MFLLNNIEDYIFLFKMFRFFITLRDVTCLAQDAMLAVDLTRC